PAAAVLPDGIGAAMSMGAAPIALAPVLAWAAPVAPPPFEAPPPQSGIVHPGMPQPPAGAVPPPPATPPPGSAAMAAFNWSIACVSAASADAMSGPPPVVGPPPGVGGAWIGD
ncbi:MAG: hypothetical protein JWM98_669, partial [Thermoleophilia bacterium]|nr:hypothetical protein [Thermoleophilia bacterium]